MGLFHKSITQSLQEAVLKVLEQLNAQDKIWLDSVNGGRYTVEGRVPFTNYLR